LKVFDLEIYDKPLKDLEVFNQGIVNTLNAYTLFLYDSDYEYRKALSNSNIIVPDGQSIVLASKIVRHQSLRKIAGCDLLQHYLKLLNERKGKAFFFGSCDKTLSAIDKRLKIDFPDLTYNLLNPGFSNDKNIISTNQHIEIINNFNPDVLFVGLGAPKQEIWIEYNKEKLNAGTICGVGAAFSYFAGTKKRPSKFFINLGLEGFIRTLKEPRQQIKKDLKAYPNLIKQVINEIKK
jgi:N-acetylglucosaminyldiphosphoundecaprenol N-acetyl-beta-D-mannosaminyltransferase